MEKKYKKLSQLLKLDSPCGGNGKCGKCRVRVSGELSEPTEFEAKILGDMLSEGWRLACQTYVLGEFSVDGESGTSDVSESETECTEKGELVIDIGTTTIEARFLTDSTKKERSMLNPQRRFGADVISRIGAADTYSNELTNELRMALKHLTAGFEYDRAVICGNTTMLHFLTGADVSGMAAYPFEPQSLFGEWYDGESLGLCGKIYLPRCVSAFVGADTTCAVLSAAPKYDEPTLIVDLGTNGELAYCINGRTICASTAAGPALEGADISCGMRAEVGAIDSVRFIPERADDDIHAAFEVHTVGGAEPRGICGSGLISVVAALLDADVLDESGYLDGPFEIAPKVFLTPQDIRAFQLAKSAIRTGIDLISDDFERLCIAGNFGRGLDISACVRTGLLPECKNVDILGNAALKGAEMLLFGAEDNICAKYIDLAADERFNEAFTENLLFKK